MRYILVLLMVFPLFAKNIVVVVTGENPVERKILGEKVPKDVMREIRNTALLDAKYKASEKAGTYVYSEAKHYSDSTGKNITKVAAKTLSAGMMNYKVVKEGWGRHGYFVKIRATIERPLLKDILKSDLDNERLEKSFSDIKKIKQEVDSLKRKYREAMVDLSHPVSQNSIDMLTIDTVKYQTQIGDAIDKYDDAIRRYAFTGRPVNGLYEQMVQNEKRARVMQMMFKNAVIKNIIGRYKVDILDLQVIPHGDKADIRFKLSISAPNGVYKFRDWKYKGIINTVPNFTYLTEELKHHTRYEAYFYENKSDVATFVDWLKADNMSISPVIYFGKKKVVVERVAFWYNYERNKGFTGCYQYLMPHKPYITKRLIKNVPLEELKGMNDIVVRFEFIDIKEVDTKYYRSGYRYTAALNQGEAYELYR